MDKIKMNTPIVEMDGDEMTRVLWQWVKDILITPYVDLKTEYYDLSLENRDATDDKVTVDAAEACLRLGVGVKCATITPNAQRVEEFGLKKMWASPNATIRAKMDGTVFRAPVIVRGITPLVPGWKKPIVIARHAYGDVYKGVEMKAKGGRAELSCDGNSVTVFDFGGKAGIVQAIHNTEASIKSFARSCFNYALDTKTDLWFSTKDTISKIYDHTFKDIFAEIYEAEYKEKFEAAGIEYFYTLIDDAVARVMRSEGGFIWALKNYDGDVMSDMVDAVRVDGCAQKTRRTRRQPRACRFCRKAGKGDDRHHRKRRNDQRPGGNVQPGRRESQSVEQQRIPRSGRKKAVM